MFTGIIETLATIIATKYEGTNVTYTLKSSVAHELKIDQSVAHNGVCLTVVKVENDTYAVTAIQETLNKTSLGNWQVGTEVNLERCLMANGRFDGHFVQGHVDQTGICTNITEENGSWLFDFEYDENSHNITVEKGSICINGVSLTCFNSKNNGFRVAIIPYTYEHTNFKNLKVGDKVNLEFDIIGKYLQKLVGKLNT